MPAATPGPPLALRITTPPGWWDLPLDPSSRAHDLALLVDTRLDPANVAARPAVLELLEEAAELACASGAVFASQVGVVDASVRFAASVVVAVRPIAARDGVTLPEQVTALAEDPAVGVDDRDVVVDTINLAGIGEMTRRRATRRVALDPETTLTCLCAQYFAALPGSSAVVIVTFTSPTTPAAGALYPLFDAIASTLRFEGDPTAGRH